MAIQFNKLIELHAKKTVPTQDAKIKAAVPLQWPYVHTTQF